MCASLRVLDILNNECGLKNKIIKIHSNELPKMSSIDSHEVSDSQSFPRNRSPQR